MKRPTIWVALETPPPEPAFQALIFLGDEGQRTLRVGGCCYTPMSLRTMIEGLEGEGFTVKFLEIAQAIFEDMVADEFHYPRFHALAARKQDGNLPAA